MNCTYASLRAVLYAFACMAAVVELGLTAYRVHWTKHETGCYDAIVVELLVTSCLAIIWSPFVIASLIHHPSSTCTRQTNATSHMRRMQHIRSSIRSEFFPLFILWTMYLVGAAIATNNWPSKHFIGTGKQAEVLVAIVALSWIAFSVLSMSGVLALMHHAAMHPMGHHVIEEKLPSPVTTPATV